MTDSAAPRREWTIAPYFIVDDVVATANYYRDKLGFDYERFWGDPPNFCMVNRSGITIMLSQLCPRTPCPAQPPRRSGGRSLGRLHLDRGRGRASVGVRGQRCDDRPGHDIESAPLS
jgi:hypothetical protein